MQWARETSLDPFLGTWVHPLGTVTFVRCAKDSCCDKARQLHVTFSFHWSDGSDSHRMWHTPTQHKTKQHNTTQNQHQNITQHTINKTTQHNNTKNIEILNKNPKPQDCRRVDLHIFEGEQLFP